MVNSTHSVLRADDRSYFAILKKEIHALALSAGFSERKVGEIDIIVAEMVSNLVKHAGGGQLLVKLIEQNGRQGIELISIDNGAGMADVSRMISDGVSTKNTLGQGLGAMSRLSGLFQVYSQKDWGTIVLARVFNDNLPAQKKPAQTEIRSLVVPKPGEKDCGDGFYAEVTNDEVRFFLGDGLGHGPEAAKAVGTAIEGFTKCTESDPVEIIRYINSYVKKTRGLVATVALFSMKEKVWRICGVGNINTKINSPSFSKSYLGYNGIIGLNLPRTMSAQEVQYEKGQHIIMCSDGLKSRWEVIKYPSILRYDLSILEASLFKDYARNTDDISIAACKINL